MRQTRQSLDSKKTQHAEYMQNKRKDPDFLVRTALYERERYAQEKKRLEIQANELENAKSEVIKLRKKVAKLTDIIEVCI